MICSACCSTIAQKPVTDLLNFSGTFKKDFLPKDGEKIKAGTPGTLQLIIKLKKYERDEEAYQAVILT